MTVYTTVSVQDRLTMLGMSDTKPRLVGEPMVGVITATTSEGSLDLSGFDASGYIVMRNNDAVNFVDVGFETGVYPIRIPALQTQPIHLNPASDTIFHKADTDSCSVSYMAWAEYAD